MVSQKKLGGLLFLGKPAAPHEFNILLHDFNLPLE
jgi:hypothetical protein